MTVKNVTLDPNDKRLINFDAAQKMIPSQTTPPTLSSFTLTPTATITVHSSSSAAGVVTALVSGSASGSVTCKMTFSDGQIRERTMTITVADQ